MHAVHDLALGTEDDRIRNVDLIYPLHVPHEDSYCHW